MTTELTAKQKRFVEVFDGNATESARKAGYAGDDATLATQGWRLLRNAEIRAAIEAREEGALAPLVATRDERQAFWSRLMADPAAKALVRLKASELLGRSQADFTDKVAHSGAVSIGVVDPYAPYTSKIVEKIVDPYAEKSDSESTRAGELPARGKRSGEK